MYLHAGGQDLPQWLLYLDMEERLGGLSCKKPWPGIIFARGHATLLGLY